MCFHVRVDKMAAEWSRTSLEFPQELAAILGSVDGQMYGQPVWSFAKHGSGYSLKLFWKTRAVVPPINARPISGGRRNRNRRRLDTFLSKKRTEALCLSKNQACESPDVTQSKAAGNRPDTTQSQAQVTDGNRPVGEASSTADSQAQVTAGNRPVDVQHHVPSPSVSNDEFRQTDCLDHSPVASHTRSQVK